jgi:hypothetical protein
MHTFQINAVIRFFDVKKSNLKRVYSVSLCCMKVSQHAVRNTSKYIRRVFIQSSACSLNLFLPAYRPNFADLAHAI